MDQVGERSISGVAVMSRRLSFVGVSLHVVINGINKTGAHVTDSRSTWVCMDVETEAHAGIESRHKVFDKQKHSDTINTPELTADVQAPIANSQCHLTVPRQCRAVNGPYSRAVSDLL